MPALACPAAADIPLATMNDTSTPGTEALSQAMTPSIDWFGLAVLAAWGAVAALCALRWFRFT